MCFLKPPDKGPPLSEKTYKLLSLIGNLGKKEEYEYN